ncbi:hypothetical protein [Tolypothrix sp. NIES-4075]|nr:hypothetical protein [Tolypothrix sp. NIES-4075]
MYYCSSGLHARLRSLDHAQAIAFIQSGMGNGQLSLNKFSQPM